MLRLNHTGGLKTGHTGAGLGRQKSYRNKSKACQGCVRNMSHIVTEQGGSVQCGTAPCCYLVGRVASPCLLLKLHDMMNKGIKETKETKDTMEVIHFLLFAVGIRLFTTQITIYILSHGGLTNCRDVTTSAFGPSNWVRHNIKSPKKGK